MAFIAGEVHSSCTLIGAMLRHLPEHSRFAAAISFDRADLLEKSPEPDERARSIMDSQMWTADRRLMATLINGMHTNTLVTGQWPKDKAPKFPTVGPLEWQPEHIAKKVTETAPLQNNFDVLRKMGWTGG